MSAEATRFRRRRGMPGSSRVSGIKNNKKTPCAWCLIANAQSSKVPIEAAAAAPTTDATALWLAPAKPKAKPRTVGTAAATATAPATRPPIATAATTAMIKATAPVPTEPNAYVGAAAAATAAEALIVQTAAAVPMPRAWAKWRKTIRPCSQKTLHIAKPSNAATAVAKPLVQPGTFGASPSAFSAGPS
jgi:hypothetical protein